MLRTQMLKCHSDRDFLAKLYALRLGFDKLMEDTSKKKWFIDEGRKLFVNIMHAANKVLERVSVELKPNK